MKQEFLSAFCAELAMMIETGIPIADGILMLADDEDSPKTKRLFMQIYDELENNRLSFAEAAESCGAFPSYALNLLIVGEKTGRLDRVLRSLSAYYEREAKIKESVRSAVVFPLVLFVLLIWVMWLLLTQILPVFESAFTQLGISLESSAGTLMQIGQTLENFGVGIFAALAAVGLLAVLIYTVAPLRKSTKKSFSAIFGNSRLVRSISSARFSASMAMTLKSGLDIDESLELALKFAPNKQTAAKIENARAAIAEGATFNEAVLATQILSPLHCRMLALSFKTGTTDEIMERIAEKSEEEAGVAIAALVGRIEPTMAFIVAALIGVVLLSVMFPLLAVIGA